MGNAAKTAVLMAIFTLGSKLLGFVREMILANFFGAGMVTDAYVMATSIPGIIFGGIFGAVATAYMPTLSHKVELEGQEEANRLTGALISLLLLISAVSAVVGMLFPDQIVGIFARGFKPETAALTAFFVRITFSYVLFTSVASLLETYLQYKGVFISQIIAGYAQNIAVIAVIVVSAFTSYRYLAFGWLLGYFLRLILLFIVARKKQFTYVPTLKIKQAAMSILPLALPVFIGTSVNSVGVFVDKALASGLPVGSVTALNYGNLLVGMIGGMTIAILTTLTYPRLAQASATEDDQRFNDVLGMGINLIAIIAIPFTLGAMAYSGQIVQIVYERGAFDPAATALTGSAFFFYAIGMTFGSANTLLTQAYYSRRNARTPMILGCIAITVGIVLNLLLIGPMAHRGLALATSISTACNTLFLYLGLKKRYPAIRVVQSGKKLICIALAAGVSVAISVVVYRGLVVAIWMPRMVYLGVAVAAAGVAYLGLLWVLRIEELSIIKGIFVRGK